ncbi:P pilus assembly protein chaperone PapD-like protein [Pandoraea horticolens]|uniref:P pilus assembly protein chaperone PapD-like protein n=1 Tax=Pandoraea horticolens TaxID=2508298 RepID=A0A5E4X3Y9_9BURK|nr:fimbria/pilus periplasmic chaperone [Pandoraea horticolens]VVE31071.1 P pilus assembly protein chaperone PapD-like protein [Pandoraea horticolens]
MNPSRPVVRRPTAYACGGAFVALLAFYATDGNGATLQVSPVIVNILPTQPATTLTLGNSGGLPIHGQLRLYAWTQRNGDNVLTPTEALIASPPIVRIEPGERQIVRLVHVAQKPEHHERSYRLLVDELPSADAAVTDGVSIRLRYSLPVFVQARDAQAPSLHFDVRVAQGEVEVRNDGERHAQIGATRVLDASGRSVELARGLLGYVLAGQTRRFPLRWPAGTRPIAPFTVESRIDAVPMRFAASPASDGER